MFSVDEIIEKERGYGIEWGPYRVAKALENAPWHVRRELEFAGKFPGIRNARQGFASADINDWPPAAFGAINTTTTEYTIVQPPSGGPANNQNTINQFCQIANNDARAGKGYEIAFGGALSTSSAAPTVIWTPRWGNNTTMATNVTLGASTGITTIASLSAVPVYGEFKFGIRTGGLSGTTTTNATGVGNGLVAWGGLTTAAGVVAAIGGTAAAIDTGGAGAAGCGLQMTLTWGTSSANNTFTCGWFILRSLN